MDAKQRIVAILSIALAITALSASCGRAESAARLALDPTPPISGIRYFAVITRAYVQARADKSNEAASVATLRGGDVFETTASEYGTGDDGDSVTLWYRVSTPSGSGWVGESDLLLCDSKVKADNAAERYR